MNLLLDTHAFLWFIADDARLSFDARTAIESPKNQKWVSVASCWEISIKTGLGKLTLSDPVEEFLPREISANHFSLLPIQLAHATFVSGMPNHHRDPFDRLLISQVMLESFEMVSCDAAFDAYGIKRIW
ncbi:MAG: PIN domain nuclease [Rhodopirellula sp.]|nr:PIN domain nuclease [Rhodopirellula sp.]MCR9209732.1 type II toxin-antitoxin system VapC family toxin [bacterium]